MAYPLWKTVWQLPMKLNIHVTYSPTICLLGIQPREIETRLHKDLCMNVYYNFNSEEPTTGNKFNVPQLVHGQTSCGTPIQWNSA